MTEKEIVDWIWNRAAVELQDRSVLVSVESMIISRARFICRTMAIDCDIAGLTPEALVALRRSTRMVGIRDVIRLATIAPIQAPWERILVALQGPPPPDLVSYLTTRVRG